MEKYSKDFIQYSGEKVKEETKHLALYFFLHITLYIVLIFFMIFFAWYTFFVTSHKFYAVKGVSMMSTLNGQITEEQLIYETSKAQKISYDGVYVEKNGRFDVFDIVVIEKPDSDSVIKRVMAVEGDWITIAKGQTADGEECFYFYRIAKDQIKEDVTSDQARVYENGQNGYSIYNGSTLWVHKSTTDAYREISVDVGENTISNAYEFNFYLTFLKYYGTEQDRFNYFVSQEGLVYVQVPEGKLFYMGDNRQYSTDSREVGFCDKTYVVGRTEIIVYNYNFVNRLWEVVKFYFKEMETFFAR